MYTAPDLIIEQGLSGVGIDELTDVNVGILADNALHMTGLDENIAEMRDSASDSRWGEQTHGPDIESHL